MAIIDPHPPAAQRSSLERRYPLDSGDDADPRFSFGLVLAVAGVLAERGYPPVAAGADIVALRQVLYGFLYGSAGGEL